jgi:hypothetical protein
MVSTSFIVDTIPAPSLRNLLCAVNCALTLNPLTSSEPGKRILWAKFTAPPESVTRISLLLPEAEPVDDIAITK